MSTSVPAVLKRPRFWIVTIHVFLSAVLLPYFVKLFVFLVLGLSSIRLAIAVPLWVVACVAVYVVAVRKSLSYLIRRFQIAAPQRCIIPSMVAFGGLGLLNFLIDVAMATNSTPNPAHLIVLSVAVNFCIFIYLSVSTHSGFMAMPGSVEPAFTGIDILVVAGDVFVVAGSVILVVGALFGLF